MPAVFGLESSFSGCVEGVGVVVAMGTAETATVEVGLAELMEEEELDGLGS